MSRIMQCGASRDAPERDASNDTRFSRIRDELAKIELITSQKIGKIRENQTFERVSRLEKTSWAKAVNGFEGLGEGWTYVSLSVPCYLLKQKS